MARIALSAPISGPAPACLRFDRYVLDLGRGCLRSGQNDIALRPKSFEVLRMLVENAGRLLSKDEIAAAIWPDVIVTDGSLAQCVKELRRALGDDGERLIKTVSRRGYRLEAAVATEPSTVDLQAHPATKERETARAFHLHRAIAQMDWRLAGPGLLIAGVALTALLLWFKSGDDATALRPTLDPAKPVVAVLPFTNLSGDPAQDYFSDGMAEDLITDLSKVSGLFVIAGNSSFVYRNKAVNAAQIGRELGTRYIVEGSVRRSGDRVRINAELIDTSTGLQLWADRYDSELKDLFELQDDVRRKIVAALAVRLSPGEGQRFARKPTGNVEAYDLWARGREIEGHMTAKENVEARKMFLRAVAIDPQFASAYASVANTYSTEVEMGWTSTSVEEAISASLTYGHRAVALDESLPQARRSLARAYIWHRQPERALAEIEQAVLLNPNYADGHAFYALLLAYDGRARDGLSHIERAMRINPQSPFWYRHVLGVVEFTVGRYAQAAGHLKEALQRNANWQPARHMLIAAYGHLGRIDDAHWEIGETEVAGSPITLTGVRERVPYRNPADLNRLLEGLRKAGVAE
ncbi:MAG TPA: winged helix-turn-helix domain-containing protein [Burkholderiales bacterium]|nr:winged helix-turn-helix domain-containing protein [Burkholderiales bacterium]